MVSATNRARTATVRLVAALAVLFAAVLLAAGCGRGATDSESRIDVFAAASLAGPFTELVERFEADNPEIDVVLNLGGSSALREQILDGAPADVFASASEPIMDELVAAGAIAEAPIPFATNGLALAVPVDNPGSVTGVDDLARPELLVGLCGEEVPCGELARRSLERAGVDPAVDTDEPDVRALLNKLAIGELDVGVVYASDVFGPENGPEDAGEDAGQNEGTADLRGIAIPDEYQVTTAYPIAVTAAGDGSEPADRFVDFVTSEQGRSVLAEHGFGPP